LRTQLWGRSAYGPHTSRSTWRAALRGECSVNPEPPTHMLHCLLLPSRGCRSSTRLAGVAATRTYADGWTACKLQLSTHATVNVITGVARWHLVSCRFTQVRARKLAEAAAIVNELLLKASTLVSSVLASDSAQPKDVQEVLAQVCIGMNFQTRGTWECQTSVGNCLKLPEVFISRWAHVTCSCM
jgi:hypothetical protein